MGADGRPRRARHHAVAFGASAWNTGKLLVRGELRSPPERVGRWLRFADGSRSRVYRETARPRVPTRHPALLVVAFQLPLIREGNRLHAVFRPVSILNTPLFAGFPGFRSKLWLTDPDTGVYRGVYQWDGARPAEDYARTLTALLRPLCRRGTVTYHVAAGVWRDEFLRASALAGPPRDTDRWWRVAEVAP